MKKICVIGGFSGNNHLNDVWYSSDGGNYPMASTGFFRGEGIELHPIVLPFHSPNSR